MRDKSQGARRVCAVESKERSVLGLPVAGKIDQATLKSA